MPRKKRTSSVQPRDVSGEESTLKTVSSLNDEQKICIQQIHRNDIIFINGVAGSGKTFLSCGLGAEYLQRRLIERLVITRPQIAAESAGFLPGTLDEKIAPFLAPLYTELSYFINVKKEISEGRLVVMPIAYCRGVTFKNCFVICDEYENMDFRQLKMMLTRFGDQSKMVFCGDISQSDLDVKGSKDCVKVVEKMQKLADVRENRIAIVNLIHSVRHPLIEKILQALE